MHYAVLVIAAAEDVAAHGRESAVARLLHDNYGEHYDWYQIGGRWTGAFDGYNPEEDPANQEMCTTCGGTGKRPDLDTAKFFLDMTEEQRQDWLERTHGCNGCSGTGTRTSWPTQWGAHDGDLVPMPQLPADFTSYAIVTPKGEWFEKPWYWSSGNTDEENAAARTREQTEWADRFRQIRDKYSTDDYVGIIVDCHN